MYKDAFKTIIPMFKFSKHIPFPSTIHQTKSTQYQHQVIQIDEINKSYSVHMYMYMALWNKSARSII